MPPVINLFGSHKYDPYRFLLFPPLPLVAPFDRLRTNGVGVRGEGFNHSLMYFLAKYIMLNKEYNFDSVTSKCLKNQRF